jgi:hypothetical protein
MLAAPAGDAAPAHPTATVAVARLLAPRVARVKRHDGGVPVLLPTTMPLQRGDFTASSATDGHYRLEIDGAEQCDGANVCLFALFTGVRDGRPYGGAVALRNGVRGYYTSIQCGAACSPPAIEWVEHGVLYTIEANPSVEYHPNVAGGTIKAVFVAAADQAIGAGPR